MAPLTVLKVADVEAMLTVESSTGMSQTDTSALGEYSRILFRCNHIQNQFLYTLCCLWRNPLRLNGRPASEVSFLVPFIRIGIILPEIHFCKKWNILILLIARSDVAFVSNTKANCPCTDTALEFGFLCPISMTGSYVQKLLL